MCRSGRCCWPLQLPDACAGDYQPGDVLGGKYKVQGVMGRGSNGVTYRVWHP